MSDVPPVLRTVRGTKRTEPYPGVDHRGRGPLLWQHPLCIEGVVAALDGAPPGVGEIIPVTMTLSRSESCPTG